MPLEPIVAFTVKVLDGVFSWALILLLAINRKANIIAEMKRTFRIVIFFNFLRNRLPLFINIYQYFDKFC
jgi:hypothetical protein